MKTLQKKTIVAALAAAGVTAFAGHAGAVSVSTEGQGETLIYPYYTARGDNVSIISVVNTTTQGKVVKVRFRESKDSRDVLDFNLFLSPYDVWTGVVTKNVAGDGARLVTNDTSCTSPPKSSFTNLGGGAYAVNFFNFEYQDRDARSVHGSNALAGPQSLDRTLEGYVEVIEQATVPTSSAMFRELKHVPNGPPPCGLSDSDITKLPANVAVAPGQRGQTPPSGGLFGDVTYLAGNSQGMSTTVNATALIGFARTGQIEQPAGARPNLADHNSCIAAVITGTEVVVANTTLGAGTACGVPTQTQQANAVSAALSAAKVSGQYSYTSNLSLATDWVITFPGKHYYVDPTDNIAAPVAPFSSRWNPKAGTSPEAISAISYDREENTSGAGVCDPVTNSGPGCFSPPPPDQQGPALLYEANVLAISSKTSGPSGPLQSNLAQFYAGYQDPAKDGGWLELTFTGNNTGFSGPGGIQGTVVSSLSLTTGAETRVRGSTVTFVGLPVLGFSVSSAKVFVPTPGQPLNNYSASSNLTYTRMIKQATQATVFPIAN